MSTPITIHHGDCLEVLATLPDNSVDAVVTDPPYGLGFMGKEWDSGKSFVERKAAKRNTFDHVGGNHNPSNAADAVRTRRVESRKFGEWCELWTAECFRVLKPGGHMLAFGGTRTWHRLACAVEDAGFEIRDSIAWMYGSGFSKGGLLGNKAGLSWCECEGGNAVPYDHANNTDVRGLRNDLHPSPIARSEGQDADMLASVQREAPGRGVGEARPQGPGGVEPGDRGSRGRVDARREESRLEGRDLHRAGQGLPDGADAGSPASAGEWLRGGTPARDGVADRTSGDASRGGASHQPRPSGQPAGESGPLPGPHESLDDRARAGRMGCPRCGGLPEAFRGFSTTLKPAFEPIVVARKPLAGTVAGNVQAWGTGALNIDGCRVGDGEGVVTFDRAERPGHEVYAGSLGTVTGVRPSGQGRWPANVVLDESQAEALDEMSAGTRAEKPAKSGRPGVGGDVYGGMARPQAFDYDDGGGASRFFYVAKATADERPRVNGTAHPTVKPLALMRWLVRLVTPPGGTVLEPFAGSGTTVEACLLEGFDCIAIEREAEYLPLIQARIARRRDPVKAVELAGEDGGLFDLLGEGA